MTLDACIKEILEKNFQKGDYFDSHTVFDTLLQNNKYHLAYLQGYSSYNNVAVRLYHSRISDMIESSGLAKKIGNSKSHTIYGNLSDNLLWQKL